MAASDWRVGDAIQLTGSGTWETIESPRPQRTAPAAGAVRPEMPGVYRFRTGGTDHFFAINVRTEESDLTPWATPSDFAKLDNHETHAAAPAIMNLSSEQAENRQRTWWWLIVLAVLFILAELRLANRTST
jgi:hypothetical protein